jgi:hypothetical protein
VTIKLHSLAVYVSEGCVVDTIAEAWLLLSDPADGGKGNEQSASELPRAYLSDDWSKMAKRIIRGFAEAHQRPTLYPWTDERFDAFGWKP